MQILISLLPFQNLLAYIKFQKVDEGDHREKNLPLKFPALAEEFTNIMKDSQAWSFDMIIK